MPPPFGGGVKARVLRSSAICARCEMRTMAGIGPNPNDFRNAEVEPVYLLTRRRNSFPPPPPASARLVVASVQPEPQAPAPEPAPQQRDFAPEPARVQSDFFP